MVASASRCSFCTPQIPDPTTCRKQSENKLQDADRLETIKNTKKTNKTKRGISLEVREGTGDDPEGILKQ